MNKALPIDPYQLQQRINDYASDIVVVWNTTMERYQVCQAIEPLPGFEIAASQLEMRRHKLRPLWTVQTDDGSFREPDESDLDRVIETVRNTITLRTKGSDFITDQMEAREIEQAESIAPGVKATMEWGANEMYKARVRKGILGMQQ